MYIAFVLKDVGRRGVSASKFPGWEVDISPIPAKDAEILANYEARKSWDIRNIGFLWMNGKWFSRLFMWGDAASSRVGKFMIWLVFSRGALEGGWDTSLNFRDHKPTSLVLPWSPGRRRRTRKWRMGCRASGLIGLMVSWTQPRLPFSDIVGAGKDDQKTKRFSWWRDSFQGPCSATCGVGGSQSWRCSRWVLVGLERISAILMNWWIADGYDNIMADIWIWPSTYKRVASMKEPVRFVVDFSKIPFFPTFGYWGVGLQR